MYELGTAGWTGRRAVFVGFYTPSPDPAVAGPDLAARCATAARWATERLTVQGAEESAVLIVALGPVPGALTAPPAEAAVRVGAVAVDPTTGDVTPLLPPPEGLPSARDIRARAQALLGGREAPTLAAVDLAERQTVAGGYAQPARTQLNRQPVATYALIASFVAVFVIEKLVIARDINGLFDMGGLDNLQPDWWRFVAYAFLHDPGGSAGLGGLPLHVVFNSFAMYIVGRIVEQLYGWRVLLATFLFSAVGAGVASVVVANVTNTESLTIGASGGITGMLGLLFVIGRVQGRDVPAGITHSMRQYAITYAAMIVVFGFLVTNVANVAHVAGFITGMLAGLLLPPLRQVGGRDLQSWERAAVYAVCAASAATLLFAVVNVARALSGQLG